jgi:CHAT domain-containing protein
MPTEETPTAEDHLAGRLAAASNAAELQQILAGAPHGLNPAIVEKLVELARQKLRVNPGASLRIAESALAVAVHIGDEESQARGIRAQANAFWMLNQNRTAVEHLDRALAIFQKLGNDTEVGRTLSTSIQALIRLGEYSRALEGAARAREIFTRAGDARRLARLELNVANIHHRQDRFAEALAAYQDAYHKLVPLRDAEAIAVALHNMAVCLIALNDFEKALAAHQSVREFCREHGMPAIAVQADYNISYLYYLRGEYSRALEGLRHAAAAAREAGDAYHSALCAMDSAEIFLELNMHEEAAEMAQEAFTGFQALGMNYESAKCLVNLAIAAGQPGNAARSLDLFSRARALFVAEENQVWPSLIDLYQALVLYNAGRDAEARPLCDAALGFFGAGKLATKEILCRLLIARLALRAGDRGQARAECSAALLRLDDTEAPHLRYQAYTLMSQIQEASGEFQQAAESCYAARAEMESLRSILRGEELKIAFMKNKLEVYERLVRLCVDRIPACPAEEVFDYMEQAKSRGLRDLFFERPRGAQSGGAAPDAGRLGELRDELNWYYHRIEAEELAREPGSKEALSRLRRAVRAREKHLMRLLREQPAGADASDAMRPPQSLNIPGIRAALGADATLVEYFRAGDRLLAAVLTADSLEIVPLAAMPEVNPIVRLLRFQFSKFRLGDSYIAAARESSFEATRSHLGELYGLLIAPLRGHLRTGHLVFVPHEELHHLPFHALYDGDRYLCDTFTVSYAPSASIYALCHQQQVNCAGSSLVLGVPDAVAPLIEQETRAVAAILPEPQLFVGPQATQAVLAEKGPGSRYVHIGTHGRFRRDNPMFSAIRLGDGYLTLYDLYGFRLPAELVTLSGCSTGLNVIAKGDELLGLVRGLLHAGAKTLMLSLWDVQDRASSELMQAFYRRLGASHPKAAALRGAMQEVRERQSHPYYWAPFFLTGSAQ